MKVACLSMAPLYGEFVLGGSQKVLNDIILGLRKNNIEMRVFSPKESNITKDSYIGDVKIEKSLNLSGSFPSPFEIPLYEIQDLSNKLLEITDWADRIYLHGDGWFLRDEFSNKMIISGIHDLVYQESLSSVFSFLSNNTIVPSNYLLETIHSSIDNKKFSSNNFSVIPNSISLDTNKNLKNKELDENLVILFPHRPDPRKGFNKAIEIANGFAKTKNWKNVILKSCTFNKSLNKDRKNILDARLDMAKLGLETKLDHCRKMIDMGVKVITGSDSSWGDYPLGNTVHETELLVEAGYSNLEGLKSVTINAAKALGLDDEVGSLESGKSADIAILDKNPLDDIKNLNSVSEVFFMGNCINRGSEESNNSYIQKSPKV